MKTCFLFVTVCAAIIYANDLGYGVQKLKNRHAKYHKQPYTDVNCDNVKQYYFKDAVIDNFAPISQQQKWLGMGQQYWINSELWGGKGFPIFVFIGGEGAESCRRLTSRMHMYTLAKQHQALMVDVEHRFYGLSYPTPNMTTENLKYLSADQSLADLARVIGFIKKDINSPNSKVITVGGSYPGNLAAWFRLKYPSVTSGSIASSAPVTAQTNFPEYMDVVAQSILVLSGQKCYDAFELAAEIVANLALQGLGSAGMKKLEVDFQTCNPISSWLDLSIMLSDLMGNVQGTVQYNNEQNGVMNITDVCPIMLETTDAYTQFVKLQQLYRQANGQSCEDASWADTIAYLSAEKMDSTNAGRPWTYQTCNEFGYFQTTDSKNQPFHSWKWINLQLSMEICNAAFNGWKKLPQVDWINQEYGDVHIAGTNIVFPSGTIDPWHALGVTNYTQNQLPQRSEKSVFIEGTAHCNDLYAPSDFDPPSLTYARSVIEDQVNQWLHL